MRAIQRAPPSWPGSSHGCPVHFFLVKVGIRDSSRVRRFALSPNARRISALGRTNTVFTDVLKLVPWKIFEQLVRTHGTDELVRSFKTKHQFIALLFAQLSGAHSLREINTSMSSHRARLYHAGAVVPPRSTLADANRVRDPAVFAELFVHMLSMATRGLRRKMGDAVRLIDSTRLHLAGVGSEWARFSAEVCGAKAHVIYDLDLGCPPARHHRQSPGARPEADCRRRGGLCARRCGQGARRQSDDAPAGGNGARLPVHLARHRRHRAHQPPHRGDVPRRDRRDRPSRLDHRKPAASLHPEPDCGGADRRPCAPRLPAGRFERGTAEPHSRCRLQARAAAVQASGAGTSRAGDRLKSPSPALAGEGWGEGGPITTTLIRRLAPPSPARAGEGQAHPSLTHTSISPGSRLSQAK